MKCFGVLSVLESSFFEGLLDFWLVAWVLKRYLIIKACFLLRNMFFFGGILGVSFNWWPSLLFCLLCFCYAFLFDCFAFFRMFF